MTDGGKAKDPLPRQPRAEFRSYYGRAVLKTPVWEWKVPAYLFAGGLSAGSAMLAAGADLTGRPGLRRVSRLGALAGILASMYFLVADLGRPERFHHMLRVAKPSSPTAATTSRSSTAPRASAAPGATTPIPVLHATCRHTSTRIRSR